MITFADIGLPLFISIFTAALIGAFIWEYRVLRKAWKHRRRNPCRVPLRIRLRESRRLAWFRLTRRMPGRCPHRDLCRLDPDDAITWGQLTTIIKQHGIYADDPYRDAERRRSQ